MSLPNPRRPMVGDTYTHEGGWTSEVTGVTRDQITIRVSRGDVIIHESRVTPDYFADTRSSWTPKERP